MTKNEIIATKVHGYTNPQNVCCGGEYYTEWTTVDSKPVKCDPENNEKHAVQALEAFNSIGPRMWYTNKQWNVLINVNDEYKCRYVASNESLAVAITDALCKAVCTPEELKELGL
jgi:hypothetical protein